MRLGKWDATLTRWYFRHLIYGSLPLSVQSALVARHGRKVYELQTGPEYEGLLRFLEASERSDPEEIRAYQETKLREMVRHAYETVPYYREVMDERRLKPADILTIQDLTKLPVLHKEDVRSAGTRLLSSAFKRKELTTVATSASTGTPLTVYWDRSIAIMNHACYMRMRRWTGVPQGTPIAMMQGKPTVPPTQKKPPFWRYNPAWNQVRLSTLHMSDENLPYYMDELRRFGAKSLETYPSAAYILARFLEDKDDYLPLTCVITTGEPLLSEQRRVIEERFQTRVFDAYGQAERVVFSTECEEHDGLHLYDEYGITEVVDSDGHPVPTGTTGLLVGTSLHNRAMPLLRYACGDIGAVSDRRCACGRSLAMLDGLASRANDVVVLPDGRMMAGRNVGWSVRMIKSVSDWQVIQERIDLIRMVVVTENPVSDRERDGVKEYFRRRIGPEVEVRVERVAEIPKSPVGKARHVISHVPLVWGQSNVFAQEEAAESPEGTHRN
jgi:phenylacetate-CoA ligase